MLTRRDMLKAGALATVPAVLAGGRAAGAPAARRAAAAPFTAPLRP